MVLEVKSELNAMPINNIDMILSPYEEGKKSTRTLKYRYLT